MATDMHGRHLPDTDPAEERGLRMEAEEAELARRLDDYCAEMFGRAGWRRLSEDARQTYRDAAVAVIHGAGLRLTLMEDGIAPATRAVLRAAFARVPEPKEDAP